MTKRINPRLVKIHWSYTYDEAARVLGVHKNTIGRWVDVEGMPALKDNRPFLILGRELRAFLERRNARMKRPLRQGEFFCLSCREAKIPAKEMVDVDDAGPGTANAQALCPDCTGLMNRRVSRDEAARFLAGGASASGKG